MNGLIEKFKRTSTDPTLLMVIFFAFFTNGMMSTLLGSQLPSLTAEYRLGYAMGGALLGAYQVGNTVAVFVAGFLPYLLGRKKSTLLLSAGILVGMVLMVLTGNPLLLLIAFAATGIGRGTMSNISNVVVSEITVNKTSSLNLLHATFAVGALFGPLVIILCTTWGNHWRAGSWLMAACSLVMLVSLARSSLSNRPAERVKAEDGGSFLRSPRFWLVTVMLFSYLCIESTVVGWLVTYFKDSGIMSGTLAQSSSSILWVMMLVGRLLCAGFSYKADRFQLIVLMSVLIAAFYLLMISTRDVRVIFPALMGLGLSMAGLYPTALSCMDERFTSSTAAVGTCISLASFGSVCMPIVVGMVAERTSIAGGMAAITAALGVLLLLAFCNLITARRGV